jgi:vacuolar-type H+-ATPase subunit I/STV1
MTKEKKGTTITNQVTQEQVNDMVAEIDKEVPENLQEVMDKEKEEVIVVEDEEVVEEKDPSLEVIQTPSQEELDITPEPEVAPPVKAELPPLEDRYKESGQEAMILNNRNEKILETIEEAEKLTEVTIEELRVHALSLGENYDNLDTFSQNLVKEGLLSKKRFEKLTNLVADDKNVKAWVKKVDDFVNDNNIVEQYPALKGHEEDFLKYASKKTHMNADLELLIAGFLFKLPKEETPKDVLLPRGSGSKNIPVKPAGLTQDDARAIRKKDPAKYMEMVREGKFNIDL